MIIIALVLLFIFLLYLEGKNWSCPVCDAFMVPVAGWPRKTCPKCGLTIPL